jgi:hypothetical protein
MTHVDCTHYSKTQNKIVEVALIVSQKLMVVIFYKMYSLSSEIVVVGTTNLVQKQQFQDAGIYSISRESKLQLRQ